ncbi:XrtA/PEP-CTERM system TPR-repeat protein PrsT [Rhodoferax sp. WC2427]|uniref:XrtA/PEP-CTERM system TPR-repeat protein PrsT n=1 Tax=Rhodoferax sp. WC2427 TaxID=3234144 RepID=UPI0034655AC0
MTSHAVTDSKASRFYEDALGRFEKRDIPGAIIQLKNALQIDRNMLPVQVLLGKALLANGEAAASEVALLEALRLGVNRAEVVVPLAQSFIAQGKQKMVLEQPQFNPAGLPQDTQVQLLVLRAAAASDTGDIRAAMRNIEDARVADPRSADAWLAEVPVRIRERKFREAHDAVARALALAPNAAEVYYQKAAILHVQGNLNGALAAYTQALQMNPKHMEARVARAGLLVDMGKPADAAKDVAEAQRLSPREPRAAYLKALLAEKEGNAKAATAALQEVTALIDPVPLEFIRYRPQLMMLNGLAHYGLNEREKARPYLEAFQRAQGATTVSKLLAQVYFAEGNVDRAIETLEGYAKAVPGDSQALVLLASAHMSQGRNAKATALMQEALLSKDTPEVRTTLGLSLMGSGQSDNAMAQLESAYKNDPAQTMAGAALAGLYLRAGQNAKAAAVAQGLVKQQPGNAGFQNLLGMALAQTGNLPGAKAAFEESARIDPALLPPQLNLARLDIASKAFDAAAIRLAAMLKSNEKNVEVLMELANLADLRGQTDEAVRSLRKADDFSGLHDVRPGLALVQLHLRKGQVAPAIEAVKKLSIKAPEDLAVLLTSARAMLANADQAGARAALTTATRVAEFNASRQVEIALLQLSANNPAGAAYSLDKALSTAPAHLPAQALKAEVLLRQGDVAKADQLARQIVAQAPKRAVGYSLQGDIALARGQNAAAIDAYRRAHQTEPSSDTLLRLFGVLSAQDGGKAALQLADQWTKSHPQDLAVRRVVADFYARSGNYAAARTAYEALLKTVPGDARVLNNLANVLLRLKDPSAVAIAEQALAKDPANASAIDTLGWTLFQLGGSTQSDRALQLLRDARLREPGNPSIRYHLGVLLAQSGRKAEALDEVEAALKAGRGFESSSDAETLAKSLR